ncbi:MAG: CpsD/CapB family tyrosine-protein kinase [Clostridia bacterium]|nr:CpsD/CapB family tyrosine-protein kinase [Clostridia bacterium]
MGNIITQYHAERAAFKDSIRTLRTNIQFADIDNGIHSLVITSIMPSEGKSLTSVTLAISMTEYGKRTLLVDADCRRPSLAGMLKQRPSVGLPQVLAGTVPLLDAIVATNQEGLFFLDSETLANPVEVLSSKRCSDLIAEMRQHFDMIIFDTPPLCSFIEAAVLSTKVDGTVLVISPGVTDSDKAVEALGQLKKANAKILGVVLNGVADNYISDYYYRRKKGLKNTNPVIAKKSKKK